MPTIFNEIIRHKARKLAKAHIKRALGDLKCGGQFNFEDCQRDINNNYWQRKSVNLVFSTAYEISACLVGSETCIRDR